MCSGMNKKGPLDGLIQIYSKMDVNLSWLCL